MNAERPHERPTCGALTRSGTPCQRSPRLNGRCNLHGGKSLAGIAAPALKSGRYSKYLPPKLAERYEEALADPDLYALHDEIALTITFVQQQLARLDAGDPGGLWLRLREAWGEYQDATKTGDSVTATLALMTVGMLIERGGSDAAARAEVRKLLEQQRRLTESERKHLVDMQQMVTAQQAMLLITAILDSIRRHVHDRSALSAISSDIAALTGATAGRGPRSGA